MSGKIVLIDGHSILNRAFYGLPDLTNSEGMHTIGRNLHDYDTMENLLYEYFEQDHVIKELFHML